MRLAATLTAVAAALPFTQAYWKGMNIGANNPDGSCKTQQQWTDVFNKLKTTPQHLTSVRLYASSDCDTLLNAVPAAISTGTKILVGVWTEDPSHYELEKQALSDTIKAHGHDWIIAISVGSEDLYRGDTTNITLAAQINEVRGIVRSMGVNASVGHVDTWGMWVNKTNENVIKACDFVGVDAYPYYEHSSIDDAYGKFWYAINKTRHVVNRVSPGTGVWVTETGWPVAGTKLGSAIPSVANAQQFWNSVACAAFKQIHIFWYAYQDYNQNTTFGMFDRNDNALYDLSRC